MSNVVGEAIIKLKFGDKSLDKDISDKTSKIKGALSAISNATKTVIKGATVAGTAVAGLSAKALASYGDYEQLVGGMDTLYKDASSQMQQYADVAYKTAGLSANEYMQTATQFSASLISSLGGDTAKASKIANQAIVDMSDNANKMGTNMEDIQNAYRGFSKQNYTMLDNLALGYGGTRKEMQRLLDDAEKISGIHYNIDNFAEMAEAIHVVQNEMGITGTTAKEASDTIQGSINSAKASFGNLMTAIASGEGFDTAFQAFIDSVGNVISNIAPLVPKIVQGITNLIQQIIPLLPPLIQQILPSLLQAGIQIMGSIVQALPQIMQILVDALPEIIDSLVAFFTDPNTIQAIIEAGIILFFGLVMAIPQILGGLIEGFGNLLNQLWQSIKSKFSEFAGNFGETLGNIVKGAINRVINFINGCIYKAFNALNRGISALNKLPGVSIRFITPPQIPMLANGGVANGATPAVIGEAGREAVLPLDRNTEWAGTLASILAKEMNNDEKVGATYNITMNNNINNELDADEIGRKLLTSIRRAS